MQSVGETLVSDSLSAAAIRSQLAEIDRQLLSILPHHASHNPNLANEILALEQARAATWELLIAAETDCAKI